MSLFDAFVPPSLPSCARRISGLLLTLAVLVALLFPNSALSGTEVAVDRWVTTGLLAAAGLSLRFLGGRALVVPATLVLLAVAGALLGAPWLAVLAAVALVYAALSSVRGRLAGPAPGPVGGPGAGAADGEAGEGAGDDPPEPEYPRAEVVRENVEAVAMALVLALTVREFAFEAFQIPTGSMYPTILGVDLPERTWGDRLLASKVQLLDEDPPRWAIVVFRYPLSRNVNYIKRVIGLPGEKVQIRGGDIYIDDEVAAKPEVVQASLWSPVFPAPARPYAPAEESIAEVFAASDGAAEWQLTPDAATVTVAADSESWLRYEQPTGASDLRLSVKADIGRMESDASTLSLRVEGGRRAVTLEVSAHGTRLTAPGLVWEDPDGVVGKLAAGERRIGLGVADRVARVYVDGRVVARLPHADETNGGERAGTAAVGVSGATATLSEVKLDKDLQYGETHTWQVPEDGFIMLGDNTHSSRDSRAWEANVVTLKSGRKLLAENERLAEDGRRYPNYSHEDGVHSFLDDWGIARAYPDDQVESVKYEKLPFARRSDLIGRAFMIFYPFPPFGDWRPRILP